MTVVVTFKNADYTEDYPSSDPGIIITNTDTKEAQLSNSILRYRKSLVCISANLIECGIGLNGRQTDSITITAPMRSTHQAFARIRNSTPMKPLW